MTNGQRLEKLKACLSTLLENCHYRPLRIGIFDNGSTDDTWKWLSEWVMATDNPFKYGITFGIQHSDKDLGCAAGTNAACEMVRDTEFAIHLESDFEHLNPLESGEDRLWLRRAAEYMQMSGGYYMYLRRMTGEQEMMMHWWSQWMRMCEEYPNHPFMKAHGFWWSNNPSLRRNKALYENGTLPLDVSKDGPKGTPGWSQPELTAKKPGRAYIHKWGLFVHDRSEQTCNFSSTICHTMMAGRERCKYGFFKNGDQQDRFCGQCRVDCSFKDMAEHENRFKSSLRAQQ